MNKKEIRINYELFQLYKNIYGLDSISDKSAIEKIMNEDIVLNNDFEYSKNRIIKNYGVFINIDKITYKKHKTNSKNYTTLSFGDYFCYYLIEKIMNKKCININEYIFNSGELRINFPKEVVDYDIDMEIKREIINLINKTNAKLNRLEDGITSEFIILNLYKMIFIFKYSSKEIYECFNNGGCYRSIQKIIKKLGWTLSRSESQQRTVDRGIRDYKQIKTTTKETLLKNSQIGSKPEDYARHLINHKLTRIFPEYEIIVGLNNLSILNDGKEIDIPIIIMKDNIYYKFAIEYQGVYWHDSEDRIQEDNLKKEIISGKGYNLFYIIEEKQYTDKQRKLFIEEEIDKIILNIRDTINKQ